MRSQLIRRHIGLLVILLAASWLAVIPGQHLLAWNTGQVQTEIKNAWGKIDGQNAPFNVSYISSLDYAAGSANMHSAHIYILQHAIGILRNDGYENWSMLLQPNLLHLASGSKHADAHKGRIYIRLTLEAFWGLVDIDSWDIDLTCAAGCDHYHNLNNGQGLDLSTWSIIANAADYLARIVTMVIAHEFTLGLIDLDVDVVPDLRAQYPSGLELSKKHYLDAQKAWAGNLQYPERSALDSAFYELGWAAHLLADLSVTQHLHDEFIGGHADYEDAADGLGDSDEFHASSAKGVYLFTKAKGTQAVGQMANQLANLIHADDPHHDLAENGNSSQRQEALKKALPLAERYTAAMLAQFLHEAGIPPTQPPLEGNVRAFSGARIPHAYIFYAPAGYTVQIEQNLTASELAQLGPKANWKGWSYIRADANGHFKLPVKTFHKIWLRPAMPGYSFTGATPNMEAFTPRQVPILYSPPNVAYGTTTTELYLEPLQAPKTVTLAGPPGGAGYGKMQAALIPASQWGMHLVARSPRLLTPGLNLPQAKEKLSPALAETIYRGVARAECSHSALQTQGGGGSLPTEAIVTVRIANLVKTSSAEIMHSTSQVVAAVDEARCRLQLFQKQADALHAAGVVLPSADASPINKNSYKNLQAKLPHQIVQEKSGQKRRVFAPSAVLAGGDGALLLLEHGLVLLPAKAGVEIEVRAESGPGMLTPEPAVRKLVTDANGTASFKVKSGSHPGRLLLRFKVTRNPEALDIRPEGTVDILVQPGLDQAEPVLETPASLQPALTTATFISFPVLEIIKKGAPVYRERVPLRRVRSKVEERRLMEEEEQRRREGEPGQEDEDAGPAIDIGGEWHSNRGGVYQIRQRGEEFTWRRTDMRQVGRGSIRGRELAVEWSGEPEAGEARGMVAEVSPEGRALLIEWNNDMVFFRAAPEAEHPPEPAPEMERPPEPPRRRDRPAPPPPPRLQPPPPPLIERYDISGTWRGSNGLVYSIRQQGNDFAWQVEGQREIGKGKINGRSLQASWSGASAGQAQGQIIEATPQGWAMVIHWSNGVVFSR